MSLDICSGELWAQSVGGGQGNPSSLRINGVNVPWEDFRHLVMYALCNTNINMENDPRLEIIEDVRSLVIFEDENGKRLSGLRPLAQNYSARY